MEYIDIKIGTRFKVLPGNSDHLIEFEWNRKIELPTTFKCLKAYGESIPKFKIYIVQLETNPKIQFKWTTLHKQEEDGTFKFELIK